MNNADTKFSDFKIIEKSINSGIKQYTIILELQKYKNVIKIHYQELIEFTSMLQCEDDSDIYEFLINNKNGIILRKKYLDEFKNCDFSDILKVNFLIYNIIGVLNHKTEILKNTLTILKSDNDLKIIKKTPNIDEIYSIILTPSIIMEQFLLGSYRSNNSNNINNIFFNNELFDKNLLKEIKMFL